MSRFTRFSKKSLVNVWAAEVITLNFFTELDSTDPSMGSGEIRHF